MPLYEEFCYLCPFIFKRMDKMQVDTHNKEFQDALNLIQYTLPERRVQVNLLS